MKPKIYTWRFPTRIYELDEHGQVKLPVYHNYLEEGATQASAACGYDWPWYRRNGRAWVTRRTTVRYYAPARFPEELLLQTWVADFRRVQSNREYDLRRASDGAPILRARTNWVYIDTTTGRPVRLLPGFSEAFQPTGVLEPLDSHVPDATPVENPVVYAETRHVQRYELDSAGHVNNAMYVGWAEQAISGALRAAGWPPERLAHEAAMRPLARETEYLRSAVDDEPVIVETRLAAVGSDRAAWRTEIRQAVTGERLAIDTSIRSFGSSDESRAIPDDLLRALVVRA